MKMYELQESLNWANQDTAERPHNYNSDDYVLLLVNVADVFNHTDGDQRISVDATDGAPNTIGDRLTRAKQHFTSGGPMDPPEVAYNKYSNNIQFINGRHRSVAAYQMGHEYIPMFVYVDTIDQFKQLVRTK